MSGNRARKKPRNIATIPPANPSGLCQCGCGQTTRIATATNNVTGTVRGHHLCFIRGHNNRGRKLKGQRWREEDRGYKTPCWIWLLAADDSGRGRVSVGGKLFIAYRVMYEEHYGPIPDGCQIHHLCEVPACVRPDHLSPLKPDRHQDVHLLKQLELFAA